MSDIVQIVPYLPPSISGVGDYAFLLAGELRRTQDIHTKFIVCNPKWKPIGAETEIELDGFPVLQLKNRRAEELKRLLSQPDFPPTVMLQYVGYGYEKRGCPLWLANALQEWKREKRGSGNGIKRLLIMYHELYAPGPIWSSSFWNWPFQRRLVARLARLSSCCFTNRRQSAERLARLVPRHAATIEVFPVFSNFGEPSEITPLSRRPSQAVIFGKFGRGICNRAERWEAIARVCDYLGIQKLVIVGGAVTELSNYPVKIECHAVVSALEASRLLSRSRVGFLDYFDGYLGKSGIFAAFCSHGVLPVLLASNSSEPDGLRENRHFLVASSLEHALPLPRQQAVAADALQWYSSHDLSKTATAIATAIESFMTPSNKPCVD